MLTATFLTQVLILTGSMSMRHCTEGVGGSYQPLRQMIVLCNSDEFTLQHETFHHIWYRVINDAERKAYTALYERDKEYRWRFTRSYAQSDVFESFADDGAYMILGTTRRDSTYSKERKAFIKSLVKKYDKK